jgi:hypothetical protein
VGNSGRKRQLGRTGTRYEESTPMGVTEIEGMGLN